MIIHNQTTNKITCPIGDSALITVSLTDVSGETLSGVAIFAVCTKTFSPVFHKVVTIVNNTASVRLTNADTRVLVRGEYRWDVRVVTDPEYDSDGNVICSDDTDEVHSVFSASGLPIFEVTGVAVNV